MASAFLDNRSAAAICALMSTRRQAIFFRRRHQPMTGHFGRLVTRSSFVTTATAFDFGFKQSGPTLKFDPSYSASRFGDLFICAKDLFGEATAALRRVQTFASHSCQTHT